MSGDDWGKRYGTNIAHVPGTSTLYLPFSNISYSPVGATNVVDKKMKIKHEHSHDIRRFYHVNTGEGGNGIHLNNTHNGNHLRGHGNGVSRNRTQAHKSLHHDGTDKKSKSSPHY